MGTSFQGVGSASRSDRWWQGGDRAVTMGSIDKYIFRTTLASFALVLVSLTGVIWITQALRGIDLMTSQGQTIITFLGLTSLVIPALILIIAPVALMIAVSHTLNKLATDSEIIVMNAAGFSPFRLFRPFLYATCVVALLVAFIAAYLAPDGMRRIKQWDAEITADVLTNVAAARPLRPARRQPHHPHPRTRARRPAARHLHRRPPRSQGARLHRRRPWHRGEERRRFVPGARRRQSPAIRGRKRDPALVAFGRYAFDMSKFSQQATTSPSAFASVTSGS